MNAYLEIAAELCAEIERLVVAANAALKAGSYGLNFPDRILIGLALKIDSALRALIDDVRQYRSESMHHLKTMAESYIYFWYVVRDSSEATAKRVFADTHHAYAVFLEETGGTPTRFAAGERNETRSAPE